MSHKLFVSLPIKNLERSVAFFKALGFTFNPKFTAENAACMLIGDAAYAMLLVESFFKTLTKKEICDTATHVEGAYGLSCESRAEVDALWTKALAGGGKDGGPPYMVRHANGHETVVYPGADVWIEHRRETSQAE